MILLKNILTKSFSRGSSQVVIQILDVLYVCMLFFRKFTKVVIIYAAMSNLVKVLSDAKYDLLVDFYNQI